MKNKNTKIYIFECSDEGELTLSLDKTQENNISDGNFIKVEKDTFEALKALLAHLTADSKAKK